MKKFLIIVVSLMVLFLNIPVIANAASDITEPTITLSETKVKPGDTVKFEIEANDTLAGLTDSSDNVILIRSRVDATQSSCLHPTYNKSTGKYELEYAIPLNMLNGEWYIEKVVLQDNAESRTYYYSNITFTVDSIVSFNSNDGSEVAGLSVRYNGNAIAPSDPTKTGYTFGGWYKDNNTFANQFDFTNTTITENLTLYAKWIPLITKVPTGITAASTGYNSINISWGTVIGASGYEIYQATSSVGTYTLIAGPIAAKYNNIGLTTNSTYYYKVRAYRMVGNVKVYSVFSTVVSAKPIPTTPINVKVTEISSKSNKLTWSGVVGASGYEIYRATSSTGSYSLLTKTTYLYYTNSGLIAGKTYYYKMRSYRTVGKIRVYSNWTAATHKAITNIVFNKLVQPNAVYGKYAGLKVEIIDENSNAFLIRKSNGSQMWVACNKVSVPVNPVTNGKYLDKKQLETYVNITSTFVSNTNYFTWVDLNRQRVSVFTGSVGRWVLVKTYSCASGNNVTPSKRGLFTIQDKGYSFVGGPGVIAKYWTRYSGNYMLHSILLNTSGSVCDGTVGKRASHGCIRMPLDMAKWYYEKIPKGSLIWVN